MSYNAPLFLVILAAGKGTRMKSNKAKVLHEVFYAPMVHHVLNAIAPLESTKSIAVIGHQQEAVKQSLANYPVEFVIQNEQLGTGHAVLCAESAIHSLEGSVMILCGDTPLIRPETLQAMLQTHRSKNATLTVMTTILDDPTHYGRIISNTNDSILAIVEQKDATPAQQKIKEINAGIYCINTQFLFTHLKTIGTDNSQGEIYLTDIVTQAVDEGLSVHKFINPTPQDVLGVNSRHELSKAHHELQLRRNTILMANGISMISPETIQVSPQSTLEKDVILHPGVEISGSSSICSGSTILAGAILNTVSIGSNCKIGAYSCLSDCDIPNNSIIAPHSHHC